MAIVDKVFQILDELSKTPQTFTGIQKKLSLPKSSAWSMLSQMEAAGSIERDPMGRYHLAPLMLRLGLSALHQLNIREIAEPVMRNMAEQTKEISHLSILDRTTMNIVYIAKIEGPSSIHIKTSIGSSNPSYCTAGGKVLLSQLSDEELREYLQHADLQRYTDRTITDKEALYHELQQIRLVEFAVDRGEHIEYSVGISSPVFDHQGNCIAALSLTGLSERMSEREPLWIEVVKENAQQLSRLMGYQKTK